MKTVTQSSLVSKQRLQVMQPFKLNASALLTETASTVSQILQQTVGEMAYAKSAILKTDKMEGKK